MCDVRFARVNKTMFGTEAQRDAPRRPISICAMITRGSRRVALPGRHNVHGTTVPPLGSEDQEYSTITNQRKPSLVANVVGGAHLNAEPWDAVYAV